MTNPYELCENIPQQHAVLFPLATPESQMFKLEEEVGEWKNAKTEEEEIKEAADVIIVILGLKRWHPELSDLLLEMFLVKLDYDEIQLDKLWDEVARKWLINLMRTWIWNGKTYHHEGKDE